MRITKISVKGLFGMFDHEIPLNQESRITIVHGPNGVGKTVLLRMVHGLFHYEYEWLMRAPFHLLRIDFENGDFITVEKNTLSKDPEDESSLHVKYEDNIGVALKPFILLQSGRMSLIEVVRESYKELVPVLMPSEMNTHYWICDKGSCGERFNFGVYTAEDILRTDPSIHTRVYGRMPDWFAHVQQAASPKLVSVMRLKSAAPGIDMLASWMWNKEDFEKTGAYVVASLPDALEEVAREFKSNSSLLRQISVMDQNSTKVEDLTDALDTDELKNNQTAMNVLEEAYSDAQDQIETILDNSEYLAGKLFCDLINQRLLFKHLQLDKEEGIKIYTDDGSEVPLATLSSGETQLCILYYQLLFKVKPDTLVMIDEPELSMNVVWQRNFLKDLQRIIELRKFDVLIATHSPEVIYDKWDWTVALGAKADD